MEKRPTTMSMSVRGEMEKLSVEQLKAVKEQTDLEVNLLNDSLNNIRTANTRLELTSSALHDLSLRPSGKKMLVPITASLYVPRTLQDPDQVLVDVGTGYFIEKNMPQAKDYCDRKISLLKSNFEQLVENNGDSGSRIGLWLCNRTQTWSKSIVGLRRRYRPYVSDGDAGNDRVVLLGLQWWSRFGPPMVLGWWDWASVVVLG
ncbi:hypothetical protein ACLB2K_038107 [Fragaria x ananassa]